MKKYRTLKDINGHFYFVPKGTQLDDNGDAFYVKAFIGQDGFSFNLCIFKEEVEKGLGVLFEEVKEEKIYNRYFSYNSIYNIRFPASICDGYAFENGHNVDKEMKGHEIIKRLSAKDIWTDDNMVEFAKLIHTKQSNPILYCSYLKNLDTLNEKYSRLLKLIEPHE